AVADHEATLATHDVSHGGLAVTLAEMVDEDAGATVSLDTDDPVAVLFHEQPGRVVVETTDPAAVRDAFDGVAPVTTLGSADGSGTLSVEAGDASLQFDAETIAVHRDVIDEALE
ncbi:phosphoribosylformylglycinamidine synthase II, partial [Halobacteriales archaeon QH_6_66_25]